MSQKEEIEKLKAELQAAKEAKEAAEEAAKILGEENKKLEASSKLNSKSGQLSTQIDGKIVTVKTKSIRIGGEEKEVIKTNEDGSREVDEAVVKQYLELTDGKGGAFITVADA